MQEREELPSSKLERGKIFAKTGLKVGGNYARYMVKKGLGKGSAEAKQELNNRNAQDVFREFTKLRGMALKLAQSMSLDSGVLPDEFINVMTQAQYSVPPMNRALVRKLIRSALGKYPEQIFQRFGADAIAAASIGQVHRAQLKDGRDVAVKVQYPNVRETINSDLGIAKSLFRRVVKARFYDQYFEEISQRLLEETDYLKESEHITFFANQYQHDRIVTPRAVPEWTRPNVLTMTFVEGMHLDAFLARQPRQADRDAFGQLLWDFIHEQIAGNYRTIHADVHPGNFLFRDDGRLGVVDFGCVKTFPQDFRDNFLLLFRAQIERDKPTMYRLYQEVDILDPNAEDQKQQDAMFDFFFRFGQTILEPYRTPRFNFDNPAYKKTLNACFKEASTFNEITGSKHFIYINKVMMGLYAVLFKLKPRLHTQGSLDLLNATIDAIGERDRALIS